MTARTGLMSFFVTHHLGVCRISPESVTRDHTTSMAKTLFANGKDICILVITLGVYQLKQAKSYTEEHLSDDGMHSFLVHKQERKILRVQIQSRHTSFKVYNLWIETNAGPNPISVWYCQ